MADVPFEVMLGALRKSVMLWRQYAEDKKNGQPFDRERNGGSDVVLYSEGLY